MAGRMTQSFLGGGAYLQVDMSDVSRLLNEMESVLSRPQFERLLYRTFNEVGRKSKTLISRAVRQDYVAQDAWIRSQIRRPQLSIGAGVECKIPINGAKGVIGQRFRANRLRRGRISASIVRSGRSRLPRVMENQGGNPPFMVGDTGFTRRTAARLPIVRVVGLGVPQMPLNRSEDETARLLLEYTGERLEHNFMFMFGSGR